MYTTMSISESLKNQVSILASAVARRQISSKKPQFTEDADHFGFSWVPPLDTFTRETKSEQGYIDILHNDPVFYNPGSYSLMASCYGVEPYQSDAFGLEPISWDYHSIREKRMQELSKQLTIRAVELCRDREYKAAMDVLLTALEQWPQNVEAIVTTGACNANLGNLDVAIHQFEHALKLDPENVNARKYWEQTTAKLDAIVLPHSVASSLRSDEMFEEGELRDDGVHGGSGSKKRRKERVGEDDRHRSKHSKKESKKSKKRSSKKKKAKKSSSSRKEGSSHRSSSSDSSSLDTASQEEAWHPILSRSKHKLWDM